MKEKYAMTGYIENPSEFVKTNIRFVSGGIFVIFVWEQIFKKTKDMGEDVWVFADGAFSHITHANYIFHQLFSHIYNLVYNVKSKQMVQLNKQHQK